MSGKGGIGGRTTMPTRDRSEGAMVTISNLPGNKNGLDVRAVSHAYILASDTVDSYDPASYSITAAGHSARAGDIIRMTSGNAQYLEFSVYEVTTNTITLGNDPSIAPAGTDTFDILRPTTPTVSSTGGSSSVTTFIRNGTNQAVTEDTSNPANSRPLPVKLTGVTGDINITANDLNVSLDHANDSVKIGDGNEIANVNSSNELQVADDTSRSALAAIKSAVELIDNAISGSEMQVDVVSSALPAGAATESTLNAIKTAVEILDNIVAGSEAQVDVVSSALPAGAATETTLNAIKTAVELLDNAVSGSELQVDVIAALPAGSNKIGSVDAEQATPAASTIKQAPITVGDSSAVRCTHDGNAPSSTRRLLSVMPDPSATGRFWLGSSSVDASSAQGIEIFPGEKWEREFDAGDYYIISDTAAQTVLITEQE